MRKANLLWLVVSTISGLGALAGVIVLCSYRNANPDVSPIQMCTSLWWVGLLAIFFTVVTSLTTARVGSR